MPKRRKNKLLLKKNNVKTFFFFLAFTSVLWLFIQFSKNYTREVEVALRYVNIPKDKILNADSDQVIRMVLNGNGFRLIKYNWKKPILSLNAEDAIVQNNNEYYFRINKESSILKDKLDFKGKVLSLQKDTLRLKLDQNIEKKIKVIVNKDIQYAVGYGSDKGPVINPDSITISGPKQIIDTINTVTTEHLVVDGLNVDYTTKLYVETAQLPTIVTVRPKAVAVAVHVSKFTEGSQKIPISLQNIPENTDIKIFPKEVAIVYRVGLDRYNEVNPRDFMVIADYAKASENSSFLTLELISKPESIHDIRLQEKQVQFVVLKNE